MDEDDIKLIQGYFICGAVLTIKKNYNYNYKNKN